MMTPRELRGHFLSSAGRLVRTVAAVAYLAISCDCTLPWSVTGDESFRSETLGQVVCDTLVETACRQCRG